MVGAVLAGLMTSACGTAPSKDGGAMAVAAGYHHTCALTRAGAVKCWGANDSDQLGNGSTTGSSTPVDVIGLARGVIAITAGAHHTCAVTHAGGVRCWGLNDGGQLGDGTDDNSSTPVQVKGLASGVVAVAAGAGWVCALTTAGGVKCWGWNRYGQLGDGNAASGAPAPTGTETSTPVDVSGLTSSVTAISANSLHACALTTVGRIMCWGSTFAVDLSPKRTDSVPVEITGLAGGNTAIAAGGNHACAITGSGGIECWGTNHEGELGNGSRADSSSPVAVADLGQGVTALAVGSTDDFLPTHSCALTGAGGVECWGPNGDGQLGNGSTTNSSRPVQVSGLTSGILAVAVGGAHTCAITKDHRLECWGDNSNGQLGNGSSADRPTPVDVAGL